MIEIYCKQKRILHARNITFEWFYQAIQKIFDSEISEELSDLIVQLDQEVYGAGMISIDISDYLKNKNDCFLFYKIIEKAINLEKEYFTKIEVLEKLQNFHDAILKYAQELEN